MSHAEVVPQEHIVANELDGGEGVLVDLNGQQYYQLNETAMFVWKCLENNRSFEEVVDELRRVYDVTAEQASASVDKILTDMQSHKLVRPRA
jgi:hypothetical protein